MDDKAINDLADLIYEQPTSFLGSNAELVNVRNRPTCSHEEIKHVNKDTDLLCLMIGELVGQQGGTKFGAAGNRHTEGGIFFKPMKDGERVQDVMAIKPITSNNTLVKLVCKNQVRLLAKIEELDDAVDEKDKQFPTRTVSWKDDQDGYGILDKNVHILWEKFEEVQSTNNIVRDKSIGSHYHPCVLPDYDAPYFDLKFDAIKQHQIKDENDKLVPPWSLADTLRPGSIMLFVVSLHTKNILNDKFNPGGGYRRRYEIRGHKAKLIKKGTSDAEAPPKLVVPMEFRQRWLLARPQKTLASFEGFHNEKAKSVARMTTGPCPKKILRFDQEDDELL